MHGSATQWEEGCDLGTSQGSAVQLGPQAHWERLLAACWALTMPVRVWGMVGRSTVRVCSAVLCRPAGWGAEEGASTWSLSDGGGLIIAKQ